MTIELVRHTTTDTATLGNIIIAGDRIAYSIEPPLNGRGLKAIAEGEYKISLSRHKESGHSMPYIIGVPVYGAVMIGYRSKRYGDPRESFIRVAATLEHIESYTKYDTVVFDVILKMIKTAKPEEVTLLVRSDVDKFEDLEMDVNDVKS